jgi:hypothetical protein
LEWPSAIGTGLRERIEILEMEGVVSMEWRTPEPTRPVAPVRIRCIVVEVLDLRINGRRGKVKTVERENGEFMKRMEGDGESDVRITYKAVSLAVEAAARRTSPAELRQRHRTVSKLQLTYRTQASSGAFDACFFCLSARGQLVEAKPWNRLSAALSTLDHLVPRGFAE